MFSIFVPYHMEKGEWYSEHSIGANSIEQYILASETRKTKILRDTKFPYPEGIEQQNYHKMVRDVLFKFFRKKTATSLGYCFKQRILKLPLIPKFQTVSSRRLRLV